MIVIKVKEDLGISIIDNAIIIDDAIKKIDISNSNEIELDFISVVIEYPGTSLIIDKVLEDIKNINGPKRIVLKIRFYQKEEELFNALFWGSSFFGIETNKYIKSNNIREIIRPILKKYDIAFCIIIYDKQQNEVKRYEL